MTIVDFELLRRHQAPESELEIEPGCFTNWLGLKTDASLFQDANAIEGRRFQDLPTGGDGVYGGYAAYASFLTAIEDTAHREAFTAIELGAGWGPWISGVGKVCQRIGFRQINLLGVEADEEKCRLMQEHMSRNNLSAKILQGAAWHEDVMLKFPKTHKHDHGGAATTSAHAPDYRGFVQEYVDVPGLSLRKICEEIPLIDYMHWNIQGAELAVANSNPSLLNDQVRYLFIATHSRPIEGRLVEFFYAHQWEIIHQHPCDFKYDRYMPSIEGMTRSDGQLFARNPRFI